MKFREILRYELAYQLRRPWPWLAFAVMVAFSFENTRSGIVPVTLPQDFILNSPFIIASVSVFSCMIWLLVASMMAGEAAARDVQTGMHPLIYTSPVSKLEYLGGRFLAAFILNALVLIGVQIGSLLGVYAGGVDPAIIGPFRPAAYLAAYAFIALPNAFIATTIQFASALFSGRTIASYFGSVMLVFFTVPVPVILYFSIGQPKLAMMADPIGMFAIMNSMMTEWTLVEKNVRMFTLDGTMLWNRLLWLGIAVGTLAVVYVRFRFAHLTVDGFWNRITRLVDWFGTGANIAKAPTPSGVALEPVTLSVPSVPRSFGFATQIRQTFSIAGSSFWMMVKSLAGLFLLVVFPAFVMLLLVVQSEQWGIPLLPRTGYIVSKYLTSPLTQASDFRIMIPLLIIYFAGELVWRERDARLSEKVDATPVPEWALFLGKFLGLGFVLIVFMATLVAAGMLAQVIMSYSDFRLDLYLKFMFGLQLPEYLLFAILAFAIHVIVNQKYVALLVALLAYVFIVLAPWIGIKHNLLIYGGGPEWYYTDMLGFGDSLGPWLWFKLYWAAWALLLASAVRLFWVRGWEFGFKTRLKIARRRLTPTTIGFSAMAIVLLLGLGGFIFYNTNVLHEYIPGEEMVQRRADYERKYGQYEGIPQPQRTATNLEIEIYPDQRTATINGSYQLVNRDSVPINSIHLEPAFYVKTNVTFDRAFRQIVADDKLGHHIYKLDEPLQPGDSLTLNFELQFERRGFSNSSPRNTGAGQAILENGTYLTGSALPVIGYQPMRELWSAEDRRKQGLPRQVTLPPPGDIDPHQAAARAGTFEAIISTHEDQVAIAPGELRGTWNKAGRRYFHYASDIPINGMEVFFSANYKVHREHWKGVDLQVYVHPGHTEHLERLLRSVRASLDYFSEQFGPYPQRFLQIIEQPGNFLGMGVDGSGVVTGGEGFFLLDPKGEGFDAIFEIVAHEMGHQWWGVQLKPAIAEGGGVISESLAWYSAMQLVKNEKGREALRRFMLIMREPNPWPPIRTGLPLLRAMDPWANYRKGPYAMYALSEYVGEDRVNGALRTLVEKKVASLATTMDMYRELQAVTPDSLQPLLIDLFEKNTFWTFDTKQATAKQIEAGTWEVTFELEARKIVVDSAGVEKEVPITEWVEMGIFAAAEPGQILGKPLHMEKHRIRSGKQTIKILVKDKPARGGIDPYNLLDWEEGDNIEKVEVNQ